MTDSPTLMFIPDAAGAPQQAVQIGRVTNWPRRCGKNAAAAAVMDGPQVVLTDRLELSHECRVALGLAPAYPPPPVRRRSLRRRLKSTGGLR